MKHNTGAHKINAPISGYGEIRSRVVRHALDFGAIIGRLKDDGE